MFWVIKRTVYFLKPTLLTKGLHIYLYCRLDSTLVDFNDMRWERGDVTFIFDGEAQPHDALTVLDNKLKVYQKIRYEVKFYFRQLFFPLFVILETTFQKKS